MKLLLTILIGVLVFSNASSALPQQSNSISFGRVKVFIVNNCSSEVSFRVKSPGKEMTYTAYDSKKPMSFTIGTEIYNSKDQLVHTVSTSSENEEVLVCD